MKTNSINVDDIDLRTPLAPFRLAGAVVDEYAFLKSAYQAGEPNKIGLEIGFQQLSGGEDGNFVGIQNTITVRIGHSQGSYLVMTVTTKFDFAQAYINGLTQEDGSIVLPIAITQHLAVLTLGIIRGALLAKTTPVILNGYALPTIDLTQLLDKDWVLNSYSE